MAGGLSFDEYEEKAAETDLEAEADDLTIPLLGLAGEVGTLLSEYKKKRRKDGIAYTGFEETIKVELGDALWYLTAVARRKGLKLSEIAEANLDKTRRRWLGVPDRPKLDFDSGFAPEERLPRRFEVIFSVTVDEHLQSHSQMSILGEEIGDPINDNSLESDHYRFHDVFHLANAAVLGWSPVLRKLLKRKRKSDRAIDDAEDGARAAAVEEAVVALIFNMARSYEYFEKSEHVDGDILAAVGLITAKLEVGIASPRDWEMAILSGYNVWRELRANNGGTVEVDLDLGSLEIAAS